MLFSLVAVSLLCMVAWLYVRWARVRQYWAQRGVPHLPPHPLLGSLTFLQRKNPGTWMVEMYNRFKTPYVGVWMFWRPALIINSPELAKRILVKDFTSFRDRFLSSGQSDPIGALNLFTTNDPLWSVLRRRLTSVFTASKLRSLQGLVNTKGDQLLQRIRNTEDPSKLNLRMLFTDYTTDVIGTAAFGVETKATLGEEDPMRTVTKAFMTFDLYRGICWSSIFFFPELVDIFRFTFFPKSATDYFKKVFNVVSRQRRGENRLSKEPRDLLDALLKMQDTANSEDGITDDVIISQAAIFLFGGFESSGAVLSYSVYELAFHPEMQEKFYDEIIGVINQSDDGRLDISKLAEAPYVNGIIKEVLRKYSVMGWLDRIAVKDYQIDDKLTIKAGTPVYINGIGMQYDEDFFPEPHKFDPERFSPENEINIKPFTYLPFGDGPRSCIGRRFGMISIRNALCNIVLNYRLRPLPNATKPSDIEVEKQGLFLVPSQPLHVEFIPRN